MSFYIVVYTAANLVGAVSPAIDDLDHCAFLADFYTERHSQYTIECEEHNKPPKRQTKIPAEDRRNFESYCRSVPANTSGCSDLPNGNIALKCFRGAYVVTRKEWEHHTLRSEPSKVPVERRTKWQ